MTTKHTPGPWEVHKMRGGRIEILHPLINEEGEYKGKLGGYYVVVGKENCGPGYILDRSNATLIAAAPDLLEACLLLMRAEDMQTGARGGATMGDISTAIDAARAAIAKTKGDQS